MQSALLWMHLGRLTAYTVLGALSGWLGGRLFPLLPPALAGVALRLLAAAALIYTGVLLLRHDQRQCVAQKLQLPASWSAFATPLVLGLSWVLTPCSLLYSLLFLAGTTGDALHGALLMSAFSLGSVPFLFSAGIAATFLRKPRQFRVVGGCVLIIVGIASVITASHDFDMTMKGWCTVFESRLSV